MAYKVEITEKAQDEAREAVHWISKYSPEKAALWYYELMEKVDSLQIFPTRCHWLLKVKRMEKRFDI